MVADLVDKLASGAATLQNHPGVQPASLIEIDPTLNRLTVVCYEPDVLDSNDLRVANAVGIIREAAKSWQATSPASCAGAEANTGACAWQLAAEQAADLSDLVTGLPSPEFWDTARHALG